VICREEFGNQSSNRAAVMGSITTKQIETFQDEVT